MTNIDSMRWKSRSMPSAATSLTALAPSASDLRRLMAISKGITNLKRAGDGARKIAKCTRRIANGGAGTNVNVAEIQSSGQMAVAILHHALAAFGRLDTVAAAQTTRDDEAIDDRYRAFVRKLPTRTWLRILASSLLRSTICPCHQSSSGLGITRRS